MNIHWIMYVCQPFFLTSQRRIDFSKRRIDFSKHCQRHWKGSYIQNRLRWEVEAGTSQRDIAGFHTGPPRTEKQILTRKFS
jgi:hypothetical protein